MLSVPAGHSIDVDWVHFPRFGVFPIAKVLCSPHYIHAHVPRTVEILKIIPLVPLIDMRNTKKMGCARRELEKKPHHV